MKDANSSKRNKKIMNFCHDCKKEIKIDNQKITNGKRLVYDDNDNKITVFKCNACFEKSPGLANFRECEVYSRVVGYLRPVGQWNLGKKREYSERKEYKLSRPEV